MSSLPEGWVEIELGDVSKVQTGPFGSQLHNEDYVEVGTPMITVEHIVNDKIQHIPSTPKVSDEDKARLSKYILKEGDIVFSRVGSVDRSAYVSAQEDGWMFSGRLLRVRGNAEDVYPHFLHYSLTKESTKQYIRKIAVGATMPSINTGILSEIPIILPPLPEQKAIADMLSSFDEKIELLREQNKTLETLAQTIFKEWFVNFNYPDATGEMVDSELGEIPKGWQVGKLGEIADIGSGKRPKNKSEKKNESHCIPLIGATKIMGYVENYLYDEDIIVIGRVGTHGEIQRFSDKVWASDNTLVIKSENLDFVYFILTGVDYEVMNRGAVQPLITQTDLKNYPVIVPSNDVMMQFNQCIKPIFEKVKNNSSQIQELSKTRDTLLPKLMSGQVRIDSGGSCVSTY